MTSMPGQPDFLRRMLLADAIISGACGLLMLFGATVLAAVLSVPAPLMRYAGFALIPFAVMVLYVRQSATLSVPQVWTVITLNAAWVFASILALLAGWIEPNALGAGFVIAQAMVVAVFAELQFNGLRRLRTQ